MSEPSRLRATAAAAAERWSLPSVQGPILGGRREAAEESGAVERAVEAGRARGYEAGLAAGRAEIQRLTAELKSRVQRLDSLLTLLAKPLAEIDEEVEKQLLALALAVGKQLARREIRANPGEIIALIRDSTARLPASARDARIHLHPEDAALVREHLSAPTEQRAWTLVEDPTQSRGGCLVRTESSQIDLRFERRVNAIVSSLMGDERSGDRSAGDSSASRGDDGDGGAGGANPSAGANPSEEVDLSDGAAPSNGADPIDGVGPSASGGGT